MAHIKDLRTRPKGYTGDRPYLARHRDPSGKERSRAFRTLRDARAWLAEQDVAMASGSYIDPQAGKTRFGDVADDWLGTVAHLKANSIAGYESVLGLVRGQAEPRSGSLLATFGAMPVAAIDTTAVRRFTAEMFADGYSYQTVKNTLTVFRAVLATAVESRLVAQNPAAGVRLDRAKAKRARQTRQQDRVFLSAVQVHELAEAMPAPYGVLVRFASYTGLRAGEIVGLRVDDLDLDTARVHVRRSVAEVHGELVEDVPKSGESRTVSLPRFIVRDMREYLAATGIRDGHLFRSERGGPLRQSNFYRRLFKPAVIALDSIPDALRFHDLRHSCAAILIAEGAHPKAICERLGHSSIEVTMDTYGHLYESADDALADALDGVHDAAVAEVGRRFRGVR